MADQAGSGGVVNPNGAAVKAEVNGGHLVRLWRIDGHTVYAEPDDVQQYLSEGWSLAPSDPDTLAHELGPRFAAAEKAVRKFYQGARKDKKIDGSDEAQHGAAVLAMEELTAHVGRLLEVIGATYPAAQAEPEAAEGVVFDPSQVLVRDANGRVIAVAREDAAGYEVLAEGKAAKVTDAGDGTKLSDEELGPGANNAIGTPPELAEHNAADALARATGGPAPEPPSVLVNREEPTRGKRRS